MVLRYYFVVMKTRGDKMTNTTTEAVDWDDIPDTPEQRALIAAHNTEMKRAYPNLREIPADTPACDTKTAENVTQDTLCKSNAVQEAALGRLSSASRQRDMGAACDALDDFDDALRAIAGGRDE